MNISRDLVTWMEEQGLGTFSSTIYIGGVPQDAPDACWWVISSGGNTALDNKTGEKTKNYIVNVYYRGSDEDVYDTMQSFEELCNSSFCFTFQNYDIIEMNATQYPTDQDLDSEDRRVGLVQLNLTVYTN